MSALQHSVSQLGDISVVQVESDRIDVANSRDFKAKVMPVVQENRNVVVDMGSVDFVDSTGMGAILSCLKAANQAGGDMRICQLTKPVRTLFELTRMHRVFHIHNTMNEALASFRALSGR